jgi:hypothetical protein
VLLFGNGATRPAGRRSIGALIYTHYPQGVSFVSIFFAVAFCPQMKSRLVFAVRFAYPLGDFTKHEA